MLSSRARQHTASVAAAAAVAASVTARATATVVHCGHRQLSSAVRTGFRHQGTPTSPTPTSSLCKIGFTATRSVTTTTASIQHPTNPFDIIANAAATSMAAMETVAGADPGGASTTARFTPTRPVNNSQARTGLIADHLTSNHHIRSFSSSSHSPSTSSQNSKNKETANDMASRSPVYTTRKVGAAHTLEHRIYIEKDGVLVSPFHDIPLYANEQQTVLNMVVEIPRWTNAKQEISKDDELNPIKQDTKKGKLRFVRNCFPHKGYLWNYGAFPQTWEDPNVVHPETKQAGDNDPLDVCEIGELVAKPGEVKQVKVLGVMALLDEGETDWKVIVIDVNDPLAPRLNDIEDVERHLPGLLRASNEWFRIYKIPDGKPENQFAFSGECKNKKYAMEVVRECAESWEKLITGKTASGGIHLTNTTVQHSQDRVDPSSLKIPAHEEKAPAPIDSSIDKWFYISGASA